jgi:cyclophilin family peptidyl-prolyl cis-trans isomerase
MKDLWIAVAIVVGIVGAFILLYYFAVRRPPKSTQVPTIVVMSPSPAQTGVATAQPASAPSGAKSWSEPPAMAIDPAKSYEALIKTEKGDVRVKLFADKVPVTVNNFAFLARQGYYDGVTFHRVIAGFMAQTGDPTGTGTGGPGYTFKDEFDPSLRHDSEGIVSMANAGSNTNGSQFFITYAPQPHLDDHHSVFGKVTEGMDVVRSLKERDPSDPNAPAGDKILTIEIIEK